MRFSIVEGEDRGDVRLYTLSSCAWCGKVKDLLNRREETREEPS